MIVKSDGLPTLVRLLSRSPILSLPPLIPQNALTTLWNCARNEEIKDISRSVGASISSEVDLQTIETALGSLLSLTVNGENKSYVREHNGLPLLVSCLARVQITPHTPQHIPVLHTALQPPNFCCLSNPFAASAVLFRPGRRPPPSVTGGCGAGPHAGGSEQERDCPPAASQAHPGIVARRKSECRRAAGYHPLNLVSPLEPQSWNYWASSSVMQIGGVVGCSGGMTSRFSFGKLSPEASRFGDRCWDGGDCGGERGWKKDKKVESEGLGVGGGEQVRMDPRKHKRLMKTI
ncbi:hypothetical protein BLNAU_16224 [Blattamonas nauphoetae]|uniref:Uncharacterized protein n=1 Tax=Blattamonas nauphoetae TaxID=2049346 RepID=A0ABQ9XF06_9EUKA|nr:hypothetical protein BLNAU_16224 [Blattamonas nauphoetae]